MSGRRPQIGMSLRDRFAARSFGVEDASVDMELASSADLAVAMDYGQFTLETCEADGELADELLQTAIAAGIAQRAGLVVVCSPHQNNFDMQLRIELWTGKPADDLGEWQEAFQLHLDVGDAGLTYGSPTLDYVDLPVPAGRYGALLTGRGFVSHGWPGTTTPGDVWRLRVWPSTESVTASRIQTYSTAEPELRTELPPQAPPTAEGTEAVGLQAAKRIRADLRRGASARRLAGATGDVIVHHTYDTTPAKLFKTFGRIDAWLGDGGAGSAPGDNVNGEPDGFRSEGCVLASTPGGNIEGDFLEFEQPNYLTSSWVWNVRRSNGPGQAPALVPFLPAAAGLHVEFRQRGSEKWTQLELRHSGVPTEWFDDLRSFWIWTLDDLPNRVQL